jgi:3-oxoacyl-[acyl-carrier protein] reductase
MKCALVTGGSRGIVRVVSVHLGSKGFHILINFRTNLAGAEALVPSGRMERRIASIRREQ